jgi:antitoxin component of RelBE/YafQ-DinJ toxin-antitoxin module
MSKYQEIGASLDPEIKTRLLAVLDGSNVTVSDFVRSAALHAIESGNVPFPIKTAKPGRRYVFKEVVAQV